MVWYGILWFNMVLKITKMKCQLILNKELGVYPGANVQLWLGVEDFKINGNDDDSL